MMKMHPKSSQIGRAKMGRGIFGPAKMGRGKKKQKTIRTKIFVLTSQVRCADMPAARQKIHFFTFLKQNDQIRTQNDQKCQKDPK